MAFLAVILLGRNTPEIPLRDLMAMLRLSPPFFSGALLALMFLVPPAHAQVPAAQPADEFYWSVSAAPRTITLGFGAEPGSEQAAVRFVCSRRDAFIAVNLSRNLNGAALERLKRIAGGEIAVTAQVERARFSYRGPVVEADDPSLPITVVLRARRDDPLMAALRGGKRLRFTWPQGVIEVTLENFTEVEPEWQQRCDRLAAGPAGPDEAPTPDGRLPSPFGETKAGGNPPPGAGAGGQPAAGASTAPSGDADVPRPPAGLPGVPMQEPPTIIDR